MYVKVVAMVRETKAEIIWRLVESSGSHEALGNSGSGNDVEVAIFVILNAFFSFTSRGT
jgi:hypothetical protein